MIFELLAPYVPYIGLIAGVMGVLLYLPQILRAYKTKHTIDIAWGTYRFILVNDILWTLYGLGLDNPIIYIPNGLSIGLCITILLQKHRYDKSTSNLR